MPLRLSLIEHFLTKFKLYPAPVIDAFSNVLFGRALMIANHLGVFDALSAKSLTALEVAQKIKISQQGAQLLLESLVVGGYFQQQGNTFGLTNMSQKWLVRDSPHCISNLIRYFETLYHRWSYLDDTVKRGKPKRTYFELFTYEDWYIYTYGMMDLTKILLPEVMKCISVPTNAQRLLDLGGSHGLYSIELCQRYPALHAEIIDFRPAVKIGKTIIKQYRMDEWIHYQAGNFLKMKFNLGYDVVLAFNIIHGLTSVENQKLASKTFAALNPGGVLFIMDQIKQPKYKTPLGRFIPLMVGLNLFNEIGGNAYSFEEVREWYQRAGFSRCTRTDLRVPGVSIIRIEK